MQDFLKLLASGALGAGFFLLLFTTMLTSFCQVFSIAMWHVLYVKSNLNSVDNSISAVILRSLGGVIFSQNFKNSRGAPGALPPGPPPGDTPGEDFFHRPAYAPAPSLPPSLPPSLCVCVCVFVCVCVCARACMCVCLTTTIRVNRVKLPMHGRNRECLDW